jgi:mono/diheme cytochrome c family protein
MKKLALLLAASAFVVFVFSQLTTVKNNEEHRVVRSDEIVFPENVKAVIDKSCYGCHSENGRSDDAKDALRWDMLNEYDKEKLVSVMDEIIEVIEKEEMPPEKFLEKKPEAKPTEDEYAILFEWAEQEADKLFE